MQQLIFLLLGQCLFNVVNSRIDAYRILKSKTIAHGINFGCYAALIIAEMVILHPVWWYGIIFCAAAFFNRQVTFDIPLNLRRRKTDKTITWDYISKAKPPKAITDRIEIAVFGYNGRAITITYIVFWMLSTAAIFLLM